MQILEDRACIDIAKNFSDSLPIRIDFYDLIEFDRVRAVLWVIPGLHVDPLVVDKDEYTLVPTLVVGVDKTATILTGHTQVPPTDKTMKWWRHDGVSGVMILLFFPGWFQMYIQWYCSWFSIWVNSRRCGCLVNWFCYQMIAKPGNKTVASS